MQHLLQCARVTLASVLLLTFMLLAMPIQKAEAAHARWCPPQSTPLCAENAFLDFWRAVDRVTGGYALDILGFPISPSLRAPNGMVIQFYERAVMEFHPQNPLEYQVQLARLGAFLIEDSPRTAQPPEPCEDRNTCYIFTQTNHTLRGLFLRYWSINGGLPVFGLALTEQFSERNLADGKIYTVQYFERNRFEAHPENTNPRYQVLLGRLGAELLAAGIDEVRTWPVVQTPHYGDTGVVAPPSSPPTSRDEQLVSTASGLVSSIPSFRYIIDNLEARQVDWTFAAMADSWGKFESRRNLITFNEVFRNWDAHDLAAVIGHEGQHAYDFYASGPPRTVEDCYVFEYRGFVAAAALWKAWYGAMGKPNPTNEFERELNGILFELENNPGRFEEWLILIYAEQCGAMVAQVGEEGSGIPRSLEGLPELVAQLLPDTEQLLATFDASRVDLWQEHPDLPTWSKQ